MLDARDCADLCEKLYNDPDFEWDLLLTRDQDAGVCAGVKRFADVTAVVCQGTETLHQWLVNDLDSELWRPVPHFPEIGDIPLGFSFGLRTAFDNLKPACLGRILLFTGHSLGAAHASALAGMFKAAGSKIAKVIVFGSPRPGMGYLQAFLAPIDVTVYCTRDDNGHDRVTDVPTSPPFHHLRPLTYITATPPPDDPWGLLAYHHIQLYQSSLASGVV